MLVACSVEALVLQAAIAGRVAFLWADAASQMEVAVEVEVKVAVDAASQMVVARVVTPFV